MKLAEHLYIIASGAAGFGLTNSFDCNVYLAEGADGYVLIDCGSGLEPHRIRERLEAGCRKPEHCRAILLTHGHADHCGGAAWLSEYTGSAVYALPETAAYVREANLDAIALPQAIGAGVYPADYTFTGCPVHSVEEGAVVKAAGLEFRAIATPGHCSGHCAWLTTLDGRRVLFSGDLVFPGGAIAIQPIWDCSPLAYLQSIEKIAGLDFDALIPSHHGLLLENGKDAVRTALSYFQRLAMPPGPV